MEMQIDKEVQVVPVASSPGLEKWVMGICWAIAIALTYSYLTSLVGNGGGNRDNQHQQSEEVADEDMLLLEIPAGGASNHLQAPLRHGIKFKGHGFVTHCVYADGTEGIMGDKTRPCKSGNWLYQYVRDTTGQPNKVRYKFVRS